MGSMNAIYMPVNAAWVQSESICIATRSAVLAYSSGHAAVMLLWMDGGCIRQFLCLPACLPAPWLLQAGPHLARLAQADSETHGHSGGAGTQALVQS